MSAGNRIVNVRVDDGMWDRMSEELESRNGNGSGAVWAMSDWIRAAIREKIAHADRSRRKVGSRRYKCCECQQMFDSKKIAFVIKPLFGKREYTYQSCIRVKPAGI